MRALARSLETPVLKSFGSRWFGRAWVRNSLNMPYLKGNDRMFDPLFHSNYIDLESQPWGLLADVLALPQRERLIDEIETRLDKDSPIGPRLKQNGQVWPAISQVMTWAYARYRPESAWKSLEEQSYCAHARTFPESWLGIWSGPDGYISTLESETGKKDYGEIEGWTWCSAFTPMTDFPISNMNSDAMWLIGLLRCAGIEPTETGLTLNPCNVIGACVIDFPLMRLDASKSKLVGIYRAHNSGQLDLSIKIPESARPQIKLNGHFIDCSSLQGNAILPLIFEKGDTISFEITW
jgi:hypothetical protein